MPAVFRPGLNRLARVTAAATLFLVFAGGLVTSTGSGLAVPDWPLSFGQFFPEMKGGVFYEHGHRLVAAAVGLLTVALGLWVAAREERAAVRRLAAAAVLAVVLQGALGGVTVLWGLPPAVSVAHACLAQGFLCLAMAVAVVTGRSWIQPPPGLVRGPAPLGLAAATTAAIYAQLILGAVMRHTGAGLAIPTFPDSFGRLVPPLDDPRVEIHFAHRVMAFVVSLLVAATAGRALAGGSRWLLRPAGLLAALVPLQVALGAATVWSEKEPITTSLHVVCGAGILATSLVLTLRCERLHPGRPAVRLDPATHPA